MAFIEVLFWILLAGVFYTYFGYGIFAWTWIRIRGKRKSRYSSSLPPVAFIVPAYNEGRIIQEKLNNTLALNYPKDKISFIFITDGSTDETAGILDGVSGFVHLNSPYRKGKNAAINRAVSMSGGAEVLIFSDANSMLNPEAVRFLVRHYGDTKVGGVSGEKRVLNRNGTGEEGIYWKYESALKKIDAELHSLVGAAGELFSMRAELFSPVPEDTILDDFYLSMRLCAGGFRVHYEPSAVATENPSVTLGDEEERKVRISAGAFQAIGRLGYLANPFRFGVLAFQFLSRRIMRWIFCPLALPVIFLANLLLAWNSNSLLSLYSILLAFQVIFYAASMVGSYCQRLGRTCSKLFSVPHYFIFMNMAVWKGFFRFINNSQSILWRKASRGTTVS